MRIENDNRKKHESSGWACYTKGMKVEKVERMDNTIEERKESKHEEEMWI